MNGIDRFVLREFQCGGCDRKFVATLGKVKLLKVGSAVEPVCDQCADEINEVRAGLGLRPLWED